MGRRIYREAGNGYELGPNGAFSIEQNAAGRYLDKPRLAPIQGGTQLKTLRAVARAAKKKGFDLSRVADNQPDVVMHGDGSATVHPDGVNKTIELSANDVDREFVESRARRAAKANRIKEFTPSNVKVSKYTKMYKDLGRALDIINDVNDKATEEGFGLAEEEFDAIQESLIYLLVELDNHGAIIGSTAVRS